MIYTNIAAGIAGAAIAFAGAWQVQNWRYGEQINDIKFEQSEAARKVFETAQREHDIQQAKKDEALNEANKRAQKNAALARELDGDVDRMRKQLASASASLPEATCEAARDYASALSDVYGSCVQEYRGVAKALDGALSDLKTLEQAWPE